VRESRPRFSRQDERREKTFSLKNEDALATLLQQVHL
jgi:hypothetical protein